MKTTNIQSENFPEALGISPRRQYDLNKVMHEETKKIAEEVKTALLAGKNAANEIHSDSSLSEEEKKKRVESLATKVQWVTSKSAVIQRLAVFAETNDELVYATYKALHISKGIEEAMAQAMDKAMGKESSTMKSALSKLRELLADD